MSHVVSLGLDLTYADVVDAEKVAEKVGEILEQQRSEAALNFDEIECQGIACTIEEEEIDAEGAEDSAAEQE